MDLSWILGGWQSSGSRRPLQETLPDRSFPCAETDRQRPIELLDVAGNVCPALLTDPPPPPAGLLNFVGPVGLSSQAEKTLEPLEHMVHTQTGPAGQFAAVGTLSLSDCYAAGPAGLYVAGTLLTQNLKRPSRCWFLIMLTLLASMLLLRALQVCGSVYLRSRNRPVGGRLVERISDEEPTVCQVSGTALDNQLMEGITYLEHPALRVSLDSGPMEGSSYLKPVEQSILRSPRITQPHDGSDLVEKILDEEPTVCQVPGSALYSQLMDGITQLEHLALGVSLTVDHGGIVVSRTSETVNSSIIAN